MIRRKIRSGKVSHKSSSIKISKGTKELLKTDFPDISRGRLTYDDVIKTTYLAWRKIGKIAKKR